MLMSTLVPGALLISFAPILVKASGLHPDLMGFYRMLFGLLWLGGQRLLQRQKRLPLRRLALLAGVAFAADMICWHRAIHLIGPGLATMLANLQVLLVAGWGFLRERDKPSGRFWLSSLLALGGIGLIVGASRLPRADLLPGVLLGLGAALTYATYLILLKRAESGSEAGDTMLQTSLAASGVMGLSGLLNGADFRIVDTHALAYLLAYGLMIQGLAWSLIARAIKRLPAFRVSLVLLLQPVLALIWDVLLFHRQLAPIEAGGVLLTLGAIWLGSGLKPAGPLQPAAGLKQSV